MAICPVCEHAQDGGDECALCGRPLPAAQVPDEPVVRLADLEPTRLATAATPEAEVVAGLEPTAREALAAAPVEPAPWIERTSAPSERAPFDLLALATCRYCRTPAPPGDVFCARCGLKLETHGRERPVPAARVRRCRFCGASGAGDLCPSCGARLAGDR